MNPLVSIIVPVYNVEDYLEKCLNSLINQTLKNIEIICVNDGSTDKSLDILNDFAQKDNRIKVFSKENSGPGASRNMGLKNSNGEYILFVDSDDWIDLEATEFLYNMAKSKNLDLLFFLIENYDDANNVFYEDDYYNNAFLPDSFDEKVFKPEDINEYMFSLATVPYNKLLKRSVLEKYNIYFPENIFFEDNPFHFEVILSSRRISITREHLFLRRRRDNSIMGDYDKKFLDVIKVSNYVWAAFKKYNKFDENIFRLSNYKIDYLKRWYNLINAEFKSEYWELMRDDLEKISKNTVLHNKLLENLHNLNKNFYLNVLKSNSFEELDNLNLHYELDLENKSIFDTRNKELDEKYNRLKQLEDEIKSKKEDLVSLQNQINLENKELQTERLNFEKSISETKQNLNNRSDDFDRYVDVKESYFVDLEKELEDRRLSFEKDVAKNNAHFADLEKELEDRRLSFEKVMSERESDFASRSDDFERYVESKDAYFDNREKELEDRRLNFEENMAKEEKNVSDKEALVELKEKELQDIFSDSKFRLFSKFISKKPKVSIIIPVYNVEDYIHQCLDSVVNQTLTDIEIICMDDGSTDNSLKILEDYKKRDNRFKILTQKNKGPGAARNKCLDVASGDFIMFLDSDDWLDLDACKTLYEKAKLNNLDMVMFLLKNYSEETGEYYEDNYYNLICLDDKFDNEIFSYKDLGELVFSISVSPCQKIYKREILEGIKFHENTYFEDNPFYWEALFSSQRIALIRKHFYLRRRREASITISHDYKFLDCISISNLVINVFKKHELVSFYRKRLSEYKVAYLRQWYNVLNDDVKYDYWKLMRNDFIKIRNNENVYEKFIKCISEGSKKFYMDTLKSRSPEELEYLQKYN